MAAIDVIVSRINAVIVLVILSSSEHEPRARTRFLDFHPFDPL